MLEFCLIIARYGCTAKRWDQGSERGGVRDLGLRRCGYKSPGVRRLCQLIRGGGGCDCLQGMDDNIWICVAALFA